MNARGWTLVAHSRVVLELAPRNNVGEEQSTPLSFATTEMTKPLYAFINIVW